MDRIGIFCSASETIDPIYFERTRALGEWLGKEGKTVVYGGSNQGLMECLAKAVKEQGGTLFGVVPDILEENGKVSDLLDVTFRTHGLSDRKEVMLAESDILVALPGGIGTFDEVFHVMASATIGYHSKKVVFYNINGYYDALIAVLEGLEAQHFTRRPVSNYMYVARTLDELKELLSR